MRTVRRLSNAELFRLMSFTQAKYMELGLTDGAFAELATKDLALDPPINADHVQTAREAFNIPASKFTRLARKSEVAEQRIADLESITSAHERDIADLQRHVRHLLEMERGRK